MNEKYCEVEALKITYIRGVRQIHYICPYCSTYTKKNGQPNLYIHCHGMTNDEYIQGNVKDRMVHCSEGKFPHDKFTSFKINVTNNTKIEDQKRIRV